MNTPTRGVVGTLVLIAAVVGVWFALETSNSSSTAGSGQGAAASGKGAAGGGRGGRPAPLVVASPVTDRLVDNRLRAVGNGNALASVNVVPLLGGILTDVLVSAGQRVEADTILARLDNEEQQIARDRAARTAEEAQTDASRLQRLFRSQTVTEVEYNRALAVSRDAQLALRDAELTLARRTITAPMAGIVGFVEHDRGNFISAQSQLLTLDDRSKIVVQFWVPERFSNKVRIGQTVKAVALSTPGSPINGTITGIGSRIEPDSRTLEVKAIIENIGDVFRPGMSFNLEMTFPGETYPAVNPLAVQWDSNGSYVWQLQNDTVKRVPALIIQRNPESVLVDAELTPDDQVIIEGLLTLREGAKVRVDGAQPTAAQGGGGSGKKESPSETGTPAAQAKSDTEKLTTPSANTSGESGS